MIFNNDIKDEFEKMAKHSGINFSCYYGYIVMFDKVSVHAITPHRLIFSKNGDNLIESIDSNANNWYNIVSNR